jgi:NADH-quinone oxidoreductase subunit J
MPNDPLQIIFILTAAVILIAGILAVTVKNLVLAALWMVLSFFGIAITYVLIGAGFFAVIQIVVYIGAIAILILFTIMLIHRVKSENEPARPRSWWLAIIPIAVILTFTIILLLSFTGNEHYISMEAESSLIQELGRALVDPGQFGLVFDVASLLLLFALIDSIYLAQDRKSPKGEEK